MAVITDLLFRTPNQNKMGTAALHYASPSGPRLTNSQPLNQHPA
jgi:hypothetical protein